jgi:hypothetical protein
VKTLTRKLRTAAEYIEKGYGGWFTVMGISGIAEDEIAKVNTALGIDRLGHALLPRFCGATLKVHVPTDTTDDERVLLLLFASRLNETGDL